MYTYPTPPPPPTLVMPLMVMLAVVAPRAIIVEASNIWYWPGVEGPNCNAPIVNAPLTVNVLVVGAKISLLTDVVGRSSTRLALASVGPTTTSPPDAGTEPVL